MNALLIEAIQQLNLKPGETYSAEVEGYTVKITKPDSEPPQDESLLPMMIPWFPSPELPGGYLVRATIGPMERPSPYRFDENDLAPGYLEDSHDLPADDS